VVGTVKLNEINYFRECTPHTPMNLQNTFKTIHFNAVRAKPYTLKHAAQQQHKARYQPCPEVFLC